MTVGTIQSLEVHTKTDNGYMLEDNIFLPSKSVVEELTPGEKVSVFLYPDKKGNILATSKHPSVQIDQYDWAEVSGNIPGLGVFVDIGIDRGVLVSLDDLPLYESVWPAAGDMLFVTLDTDKRGRLLAVPATEGFFAANREAANEDAMNQPISGRVYQTDKEGTAIISEEGYRGFIHHTERLEEPRLGEWVQGRVIAVKDDGTLNISRQPLKQERMPQDAVTILEHLGQHGGVIPFDDKSDPEDIRGTFNMSKAAFKRALGRLMKEGEIEQRDGNTYLT